MWKAFLIVFLPQRRKGTKKREGLSSRFFVPLWLCGKNYFNSCFKYFPV